MEFKYEGNSLKSGIYKITNKINNKIYIGSAKEFKTRARQHLSSLKNNKHQNKHLQASFNKHGTDNFVFTILEVLERQTTRQRRIVEQKYLDEQIRLGNWGNCYNSVKKSIKKQGPWTASPEETKIKRKETFIKKYGVEHWSKTDLAKRKISETTKRQWQNKTVNEIQELIEKLHSSCRGRSLSKKHKEKISLRLIGSKKSNETKKRMSISKNGKTLSVEHIRKLSLTHMGNKVSKKTRKKLSEALKGKNSKTYENIRLISPDGKIYSKIECLAQFCRDNALRAPGLCCVLSGKRKSHKGWRLF